MSIFRFKHFHIRQQHAALKVGTDAMILGAICSWEHPKRLLDIGTGTGVLSLMCAQRFAFEEIVGIELSEEAFKDARINAQSSPFESRISMVNQSVQEYEPEEKFDAIISNPPFFENSLRNQDEQKSLARHTESLSFSELIASISRLLSDNGKAWIIVPYESSETIIRLAAENNLCVTDSITIFGKPGKTTRMILSFSKQNPGITSATLCIRTEDGSYTEAYKTLTKEYHNRPL